MLEANDHRRIAQRLQLWHQEDDAPGMLFWHPRGLKLYRLLEDAARRELRAQGYQEVRSPQLLRQHIWELSGHDAHFAPHMFVVEDEGKRAALKPVSCPAHLRIAAQHLQSYRDLPLRLAEFGLVHRNEPGGSLHGSFRLRQFSQDDGHIFCVWEDVVGEVAHFVHRLAAFYARLNLNIGKVALSLRPEDRFGDDDRWDRAEAALAQGLDEAGVDYVLQPGEGAFYGPKIEWLVPDAKGKLWQAGTIQLDLFMPQRFGLSVANEANEALVPAMLHRAIYGSLERFMGLLLEQSQGRLPAWLAPLQVAVMPISDEQQGYAERLLARLRESGARAELWNAAQSLSRRLVDAHQQGVPYRWIVGAREASSHQVSVALWDEQRVLPLDEALARLGDAMAS